MLRLHAGFDGDDGQLVAASGLIAVDLFDTDRCLRFPTGAVRIVVTALLLRFAKLKRGLLAGRHALFRHREQHRDGHVGSSDCCQIHHLLLTE